MSSQEILVALRRIMRAIDLHSKKLERQLGLTVPQLLIMSSVQQAGGLTVSQIARQVSLSQGTVTSVLDRLEKKGCVQRTRGRQDRRQVSITLTEKGRRQLARSPNLLQADFTGQFETLEPWEQKMLTAAVERIAALMSADAVDAAPILQVGEIESDRTTAKPAQVAHEGKKREPDTV